MPCNPCHEEVQIKLIPPPLFYVCGVHSAYCMFVVCHCVRECFSVGVVTVLFDSLIYSVLPSSLLLCLRSSVASALLPDSLIARYPDIWERDRTTSRGIDCVCWWADCDSMPCVCVTGPQEEATLGSAGWTTPEELSEQASQAQHLERLAQLCIMSKQ